MLLLIYNKQGEILMKGSSLTQTHMLKVNIGFHVIQLVVKFSCDIVLTLKTRQNKLICETLPRPLSQGRCQVNQQLELQWQAVYDVGRSEYLQTSMEIIVMVNSINGNIQAGTCSIDITNSFKKSTVPLKKCSDKSASICLSSCFQFLHVIQQKDHHESEKVVGRVGNSSGSYVSHGLKRMKSVQLILKNQESQLSISKVTVSNKRLECYLRGENEQLKRQIEILQGKLKISERKQKEITMQFRQAISKYEKLNNRSSSLQNSSEVNQMVVIEKDRVIRNLQTDLKNKQLKVKEISEQQLNFERKYEMKEQNYQQQIKKLTDKTILLQSQLQQLTQCQNNLLAKYERAEKNTQTLMKDREKNFVLQKAKIMKELNERVKEISNLEKEKNELREKLRQIEYVYKKQKQSNDLQKILSEKNQEFDSINQENIKIKQKYRELEEQLQELRTINEERQPFRRKINELQSQNNSLKMKLEKSSQFQSLNESKLQEFSKKQEQFNEERKRYQQKIDEILSNNLKIQSNRQQLEKEIDYYKQSYQKLAEILKDTREKKEENQNRLNQQFQSWRRHIQLLSTQKTKYENENNDLKWQIERYEQNVRQSQSTINTFKSEAFSLKQQLLLKQQKYQQFQSKKQQFQEAFAKLQEDLEAKQGKIKDLIKSNGQKASKIALMNIQQEKILVQIQQLKRENANLINQIKLQRSKNDAQLQQMEKILKAKQTQISQIISQSNNKSLKVQMQKQEIQSLQNNLEGLLAQNIILSNQNLKFSSNITHRQSQIKSLKQITIQQEREIAIKKSSLQRVQKELHDLSNEFIKYKQSMSDSVRWVLCLLGQQELIVEEETKLFSQENLRDLQIDAIKNRNLLFTKMNKTMKAIKQEKEFLTFELQKIGQQLVDSTHDYQQLLQHERSERNLLIKQFLAERATLITEIEEFRFQYQELKISNDNYFKQNRLLEHQVGEFQQEKNKLTEERQQFSQKIKECRIEATHLNDKLVILHRQIEEKNILLSEQRNKFTYEEKNRLQNQISILQSKINIREQEISIKDEKIKQLEEKYIIVDNQKRKIQFSLTVLEQLLKDTQFSLEDTLKSKSELLVTIKSLETDLEKKEKEGLQKQLQLLQSNNKKAQIQQKVNDLLQENEERGSLLKKIEEQIAIKSEELKESKSKAKEVQDASNKHKQVLEGELNKLRGQIGIYKLINQKSQQRLKEMSDNLTHLQNQLENKRQFISKLQSDHEMVQKEVYFQQSHKNTLIRQYEELSENYEHAKSEIYLLEEEKMKLEKQISALNQSNRQMEKMMEESRENSRMKVGRQVGDLRKKLQTEESKFHKLEAKFEEVKQYLKEAESEIERKEFLILACEQQKQKFKCDFQEQIERLTNQIDKMHERQEQLTSDYKEEREQLMKQVQQSNQQCMQLNELVRKREEELDDIQRQNDSSLRKIQYLESEMKQTQNNKSPRPGFQTPEVIKDYMRDLKKNQIKSNLKNSPYSEQRDY